MRWAELWRGHDDFWWSGRAKVLQHGWGVGGGSSLTQSPMEPMPCLASQLEHTLPLAASFWP